MSLSLHISEEPNGVYYCAWLRPNTNSFSIDLKTESFLVSASAMTKEFNISKRNFSKGLGHPLRPPSLLSAAPCEKSLRWEVWHLIGKTFILAFYIIRYKMFQRVHQLLSDTICWYVRKLARNLFVKSWVVAT